MIKKGDLVQNKRSRRTYQVLAVNPDGTLHLWAHGWPRIRRANPKNWIVIERLELEVA